MSKEVILYDFCGTLVDFQTANAFVLYASKCLHIRRSLIDFFRIALYHTHLMPLANSVYSKMSVNKALLLYRLKGYEFSTLDTIAREFYDTQIKPHLIPQTIQRLKADINEGKTVAIISGGYDIYLKYFIEEFKIPFLICTKLQFINNIFTGKIIGKDCMGQEKVTRLHDHIPIIKSSTDKISLTLYSDSETDIPLFNECDNRIVIINGNETPEWIENINAEVINYANKQVP